MASVVSSLGGMFGKDEGQGQNSSDAGDKPSASHAGTGAASSAPGTTIFSSIRTKLIALLVVFGLVPALILIGILYTQEGGIKTAMTNEVAGAAISINDVIDRNLFERQRDRRLGPSAECRRPGALLARLRQPDSRRGRPRLLRRQPRRRPGHQ